MQKPSLVISNMQKLYSFVAVFIANKASTIDNRSQNGHCQRHLQDAQDQRGKDGR